MDGRIERGVTPPAAASSGRLVALDVLRAVAVVLVLGNHMPAVPEFAEIVRKPLRLWQHAGWIGVDLFFVLSGFLVSGLLFREQQRRGRLGVGRFLFRRGLKIYPALYFLVAVTIVVRLASGDAVELHQVVGELLFLQNYYGALWGHTWSLAVEEHFYLGLPVVLLVLWRLRRSANPFGLLPRFFLVVAAISLVARIYLNLVEPYRHGSHLLVTHLRTDGLLFGVLLSYYFHYSPDAFRDFFAKRGRLLLVGGLLMTGPVLLLPRDSFVTPTIGLTLVYLTGGVLLALLLTRPFPNHPLTRWAAYVGAHSYSIYLWHMPVLNWGAKPLLAQLDAAWWLLVTPAYMVVSVVVGVGMAKLVEMPVLRLRDHWMPSTSGDLRALDVRAEQEDRDKSSTAQVVT